ncbi:MAG: hypothetical protein ABWY11_10615 [Umezawaea sp.]
MTLLLVFARLRLPCERRAFSCSNCRDLRHFDFTNRDAENPPPGSPMIATKLGSAGRARDARTSPTSAVHPR